MLTIANVLALALIAADAPTAETALKAREVWQLPLPDAIRIGLENSEVLHVVSKGDDLTVIARVDDKMTVGTFKAAMMAHVRSVEQQYWSLAQQQVALWSCETAVKLGEEILRRERAELEDGRATVATVAEAEQQLENFKLNLVSATSDLITTERQLRFLLGLKPEDGRRITACSAPIETKLEPDWEANLDTMWASQPDIVRELAALNAIELRMSGKGDEREKQKAKLQEVVCQNTYALSRSSHNVIATQESFRTSQGLRAAAQKRLEAERAAHQAGQISIDRLLDAVSQYANAIAIEAQYKSTYNTSIAALEEAKGTLLAHDRIAVIEDIVPARPKDDQVATAGFEKPEAAQALMPKISKPRVSDNPEAEELWSLTLREAIRIGLENSEIIRVIALGTIEPGDRSEVVIARLNADGSAWKFQAAVMAHVRSIEQQYWSLWQQQVALETREAAVKDAEKILARERAELESSRGGNVADIAEAEQQLENFKLNLVTTTSDLITTERQLRNILGLKPSDGRRIITATRPTEARLEPDWEASTRVMLENQPDVAEHRALVRLYELQLLLARNQLLPLMGLDDLSQLNALGCPADAEPHPDFKAMILDFAARSYPATLALVPQGEANSDGRVSGMTIMPMSPWRLPLSNTRQAQYQLIRQRASLQQITHQATHSLARFFLEVDANYKQYRTARRLAEAAKQRLEAQRAFDAEGRITIDRLLDAISQNANAISQEAQYLASYNGSIASFEEAKGTLLGFDGIALDDNPRPAPSTGTEDGFLARTGFEKPLEAPKAGPFAPRPVVKSFRLKARLGLGGLDLEIEVLGSPEASPTVPALP